MLTPEEELEFTNLNAVAFDLMRTEAAKTDTRIPCWLCMSAEAKEEARQKLIKHLRQYFPKYWADKAIVDRVAEEKMDDIVRTWKAIEVGFKQLREQNNPAAYFC